MMRPQITRLRSSQYKRQSIRTSLNRSTRLKISILREYSSRKAFFSLGRRESIRRFVKATTIGAMKTNCKSRWIFWNRMRGMRPVCTIPGCWTAARAVRGRCIKENRIVISHSRRSSITVQPVSIRPRFYAGESGSAYRMNSEQMDSAIIRVQFICG